MKVIRGRFAAPGDNDHNVLLVALIILFLQQSSVLANMHLLSIAYSATFATQPLHAAQ